MMKLNALPPGSSSVTLLKIHSFENEIFRNRHMEKFSGIDSIPVEVKKFVLGDSFILPLMAFFCGGIFRRC
jgi:hypothetical protein